VLLITHEAPKGANVNKQLTGNNIMKDSNYKGFLLMLTAGQRARLQTKANQATDGNITKLLQAYADNVEIK